MCVHVHVHICICIYITFTKLDLVSEFSVRLKNITKYVPNRHTLERYIEHLLSPTMHCFLIFIVLRIFKDEIKTKDL